MDDEVSGVSDKYQSVVIPFTAMHNGISILVCKKCGVLVFDTEAHDNHHLKNDSLFGGLFGGIL